MLRLARCPLTRPPSAVDLSPLAGRGDWRQCRASVQNHLLRAALRGPAPAALLRRAGERLLHRHRRRPSGLRQRLVRVLSARLARHHGRAQPLARATERGGAAARRSRRSRWSAPKPGEATYYLVEDFHGLSTTVEHHARAAQSEFGKRSQAMTMPVTTLRGAVRAARAGRRSISSRSTSKAPSARCCWAATGSASGPRSWWRRRWRRSRWRRPGTRWEPLLTGNGYRFALFDGLNRYYVAEEHAALAERLAARPDAFDGVDAVPRLQAGARRRRASGPPPRPAVRGRGHGAAAAARSRRDGRAA